jgi:hypothetical protein
MPAIEIRLLSVGNRLASIIPLNEFREGGIFLLVRPAVLVQEFLSLIDVLNILVIGARAFKLMIRC